MGRRKITITPIQDDRNRNVTFGKRRNGLFKKAYELGVLCSVDVAVLVWGHNGKLHVFSSQGSMHNIMDRYSTQSTDETEVTGPRSYGDKGPLPKSQPGGGGGGGEKIKGGSASKKRRRGSDDSDEEEDEDEVDEEDPAGPPGADAGLGDSHRRASHSGSGLARGEQSPAATHFTHPHPHQHQHHHPPGQPTYPGLNGLGSAVMSEGYPMPQPFFGGYPYPDAAYPGGPQAAAAAQHALQSALGFYPSPSAQAQAQARAHQAAIHAAAYGLGGAYPSPQTAQQRWHNAYNSISNPGTRIPLLAKPRDDPPYDTPPGSAGGGGELVDRSSPASSIKPPSLHLSLSGMKDQGVGLPESSTRLEGNNGTGDSGPSVTRSNSNGHNHEGGASAAVEDSKKSLLNASDSLLHLSESYIPSPSQLFPEIYRQMAQYGEQHALHAMDMSPHPEQMHEPDEQGNSSIFRWPSLTQQAYAPPPPQPQPLARSQSQTRQGDARDGAPPDADNASAEMVYSASGSRRTSGSLEDASSASRRASATPAAT